MFWCSENKRPTGRAAAAHARVQSGVRGACRQAHTQPHQGLSAPTRARVSSQRSAESLTALEAADLAGRRSLRRRPLPSPTNAPPPATLSALRPRQCPRCALPAPSSPAQGRSPGGRAPPWLWRGAGQPEGSTAAAAEQEVSVGEKEPLSGGRGTSGPAEARRPNWSGTQSGTSLCLWTHGRGCQRCGAARAQRLRQPGTALGLRHRPGQTVLCVRQLLPRPGSEWALGFPQLTELRNARCIMMT